MWSTEDYIHKTPLSSTNIANQQGSIKRMSSANDLAVEDLVEKHHFHLLMLLNNMKSTQLCI
jgi:hypothetical protein